MSKKGNRGQRQQKNAQKNALKSRRRVKAVQRRPKPKAVDPTTHWPAEEFLFWVAQGVNYLLSDYANGIWTPLFNDIYEEDAVPPQLADMQKAVMAKFGPDDGNWPAEGRAALGWTVQNPQAVYTFYSDALSRIAAKEPEGDIQALARKPHYSPVWETFEFLKEQLVRRSQ